MNLADIMLFGNAINGGGSSSSGVKCVYFDHNNIDKYEKTVLHDGDTEIVYVKISDETPSYEEVLKGVYTQHTVYTEEGGGGEYSLAVEGDKMLEAVKFIEEFGLIIICMQFSVLLNGIEEMGLSAGTYAINPESDADIIQFAALTWGFR